MKRKLNQIIRELKRADHFLDLEEKTPKRKGRQTIITDIFKKQQKEIAAILKSFSHKKAKPPGRKKKPKPKA